ncbi:MAG: DEAD/DEAH box helicase [candidate division KSB1 bacterium]|jgi:superfamily II DNA or RNA helicase|nr:DEAD/DEAH box helicase [candidate division KSB1 bacterium]
MNNNPRIPRQLVSHFSPRSLERGKKLFREKTFRNFDFVRNSYRAQFSEKNAQHWATVRKKQNKDIFTYHCTCGAWSPGGTCHHLAALLYLIFSRSDNPKTIYGGISSFYYKSIWQVIAKENHELYGSSKIDFHYDIDKEKKTITLRCFSDTGELIFSFNLPREHWGNIMEKYRYSLFSDEDDKYDDIVDLDVKVSYNFKDMLRTEKTELEDRMNLAGYKSWLQKFEESYWFDFSKIWFLTMDESDLRVEFIQETNSLRISSRKNDFHLNVRRNQIANILDAMLSKPQFHKLLKISSRKVKLNYQLKMNSKYDLRITPVLIMPDGDTILLNNRKKITFSVFGKYIYFEGKGFYQYEREIPLFDSDYFGLSEVIVANEMIPRILKDYNAFIDQKAFHYISPSLIGQKIVSRMDSALINVDKMKDDWCHLDVRYRVANSTISFQDIFKSIEKGKKYFISKAGWIDLSNETFEWIRDLKPEQVGGNGANGSQLKLNRIQFLKLQTTLPEKHNIITHGNFRKIVDNLLQFKPLSQVPELDNRKYVLRDYQKAAYGWLWFLYESRLSGLLCDDMGLGKTYESLALLDAITFVKKKATFLVVCPTSVIPHWKDKLSQLKKNVHLHVYHGSERDLKYLSREKYAVILTSYGVMRNDLYVLQDIPFEAMILDEIQIAKNKTSLTNAALLQLNGVTKIGLTGTPIENDLNELKALFDIILPNFLGSDASFKRKYVELSDSEDDNHKLKRLHNIINPFTLRRTKGQVLSELPPKTEELRKCELSPDQVKLYRDVLETRAESIVHSLGKEDEKIPYMHVFAVLNYLKQICNHPSQLEKNNTDYNKYSSGKWDLFCELLEESLNSGFKVVIFSQYLNMLALIEAYLKDKGISFATIKGSTRNRAEMIEKFNTDPECMVFTGSLKASGMGINLTGGSVVIHYDRWWNAAREDQATDRVHRIGQTRGVQVFKLITEGTLEEKIDRLIAKKKKLFENLVTEDDAKTIKQFTREELIELLSY